MPREFVLLSAVQPGDAVFRAAAAGFEVSLDLDAGGLLARFHTVDLDPLVTVLHPRLVGSRDEIARLLPVHPPLPTKVASFWWSDVLVPWGRAQDPGRRLAEAIARASNGHLVDSTGLADA